MRILNVTAQRPDATGSGTYLAETVRCMDAAGHDTAVVCGLSQHDRVDSLPAATRVFPVLFDTGRLPFHVCGMSDQMPYPSTRYRDLTPDMARRFQLAFREQLVRAVEEFSPDLVLCHHLYLVTAVCEKVVSELAAQVPVGAVCHSTDLRQMATHGLERELIVDSVRRLDVVFALHDEQAGQIRRVYGVDPGRVRVLGSGFRADTFSPAPARLVYAGKIWRKKGVESLLRAADLVSLPGGRGLELRLCGGHGQDDPDYPRICAQARDCRWPVELTGRLDQQSLAEQYRWADVFCLPSFFEGLPLVAIEAMACGCVDVLTDLPGIRPWVEGNVAGARVVWVEPPRMQGVDEPVAADLPGFEERLARAIERAVEEAGPVPQVSELSWEGLTARAVAALAAARPGGR